MAFLRNWLSSEHAPAKNEAPSFTLTSPQSSDDEGQSSETQGPETDDDSTPAFPSLNSAQRLKSTKCGPSLTDAQLMPPPPLPGQPFIPSSSTTKKPITRKRTKAALAPGHSSLDWALLKSSGEDLRGVDDLAYISPSVLKMHNKRTDAWSAFFGKVYNITPYLSFHPGGEKELLRVAGRDGTKLFAETHAWVNADIMLDSCLVGFLVPEPS